MAGSFLQGTQNSLQSFYANLKNGSSTGDGRVTTVILLDAPFNVFFFLMAKS